jgi:uncharacterized membrane protein YtjA (UPF0391 family)
MRNSCEKFRNKFWELLCAADRFFYRPRQTGALIEITKETLMLGWALTFLAVAIIAAVFGFGGIASASAGIAQVLFFIFIMLFLVAMIARAVRGKPPV